MLHDPVVGTQIQALRFTNKRKAYGEIIDAVRNSPTTTYKETKAALKRIKFDNAALILAMSKELESIVQTLNAPQVKKIDHSDIHSLYDNFAQDKYGNLIDTDLPFDAKAFKDGVERYTQPWQNLFQNLDKKK